MYKHLYTLPHILNTHSATHIQHMNTLFVTHKWFKVSFEISKKLSDFGDVWALRLSVIGCWRISEQCPWRWRMGEWDTGSVTWPPSPPKTHPPPHAHIFTITGWVYTHINTLNSGEHNTQRGVECFMWMDAHTQTHTQSCATGVVNNRLKVLSEIVM